MKRKRKTQKHNQKTTVAILYHYVPKTLTDEYFSHDHAIIDNQTDEIVYYMKKLFIRHGYSVQIIKVSPDDLSELKKLKADFVFNLVDSKAMEIQIAKILDRLKIPHSGSSFEAIKNSNNKIHAKRVFEKFNLPL